MGKHRNHFAPRSEAYEHCRLCEAILPCPTSGHLRRHYRTFHLVTKEAAIDTLVLIAEEQAGIAPEAKPTGRTLFEIFAPEAKEEKS